MDAKDAAEDGRTPFERLTEFARKIIQVPKEEVPKPPKRHKKKKRAHPR